MSPPEQVKRRLDPAAYAAAWIVLSTVCLLAVATPIARADDDPDAAPIRYHTAEVHDPVAKLQTALDAGEAELDWHDRWGWLPSVLEKLDVPIDSQTLVFSKTSLQATKITPHRPRALYYNDAAYVGYVQRGEVLEIMSVDPVQGPIFYTLDQKPDHPPRFQRDTGECLSCHLNRRTRDVPGLVVRSVYPDHRGHPLLALGDEATDPTTPLSERYGGWYVTGETKSPHRGNAIFEDTDGRNPEPSERQALTLSDDCNPERYLTPHSDLVALMVLEHQAQVHNAITRASYEARRCEAYDAMWGELLEKPAGYVFPVSTSRIERATEDLLECLLFSGEHPLDGPIAGSSEFTESFQAAGERDASGRSLRDFDLHSRLFRYPCSYLIRSESFAALPPVIRDRLGERLGEVLRGEDVSPAFAHLSGSDREAIAAILRETKAPVAF